MPNTAYLDNSGEDPSHIPLYRRENEPAIEGSRLVIVEDDQPSSQKGLIPALERHVLATDLKGTVEHLKALNNNSIQKQITVVTEDMSRVSRNEGTMNESTIICNGRGV